MLDLSKILMEYFQYNFIKSKYDDQSEILLTDTDTIVSCIKLRLEGFMKTYTKIKSYLTSVIIEKIQNITMVQILLKKVACL